MRNSIFILLLIFSSLKTFAQQTTLPPDFDQITLDGQPAYINVKTGDIVKERPTGISYKIPKTQKTSITTTPSEEMDYMSNTTHRVAKGETLYAISKKYNTSIAELTALNPDIAINNLRVNQQINVPDASTTNATEQMESHIQSTIEDTATSTNLTPNETTDVTPATYQVQSGDTLYSISRKFNLTVSDLKEMNKLSSTTLSVGQTLVVKK